MRPIVLVLICALIGAGCQSHGSAERFRVPPGFSVEPAAASPRLGPLAAFTFDSFGRPVVARERGFPTLLLDQNRDGIFETEVILTTKVRSVESLWFDGRTLYVAGLSEAGQRGLYRLEDRNGDDELDALEQLSALDGPAADIRRSPDGLPTIFAGGRWLRWNEVRRELVAPAGDSGDDPGADVYQNSVYRPAFRGAMVATDSSGRRILVRRLTRDGAAYRPLESMVAEFAMIEPPPPARITHLEVGRDGFIYFSTGEAGGLYRIVYTPGLRERWQRPRAVPEGALALVGQPQPLSSWGHAALLRQKELLGALWGEHLEALALDRGASTPDRVQAILMLRRFGPLPKIDLLKKLAGAADPEARAGAIYVAGQLEGEAAKALAAAALADTDALVRRRAAEAMLRLGLGPEDNQFAASLYKLLGDPDRFVREAGRRALERVARENWRSRVLDEKDPRVALEGMLALLHAAYEEESEAVTEKLLPLLAEPTLDQALRLDAVRLLVIATAASKEACRQASGILLPRFPSGDESLDRELARAMAQCSRPEAIRKILAAMPPGDRNQALQIHYASCLALIKEGWTGAEKESLLTWFQKAAERPESVKPVSLLFDAVLQSAFTREERRQALRRIPKLARGAAADPQEIFEQQMALPTAAVAAQGREIFQRRCASCHRLGGPGNEFGPDLTSLAARLDKQSLLEAILWPSRTVAEQFKSLIVETSDGHAIEALLVREDARTMLLKTAADSYPISIPKNRVRNRRTLERSIMPDGLLDGLDQTAIANLLAFLLEQ